jgi:hypothetical protein
MVFIPDAWRKDERHPFCPTENDGQPQHENHDSSIGSSVTAP